MDGDNRAGRNWQQAGTGLNDGRHRSARTRENQQHMSPSNSSTEHSLLEDAQAFLLSTSVVAFSVTMLTHMGLITGQTAGLAVLIAYLGGWEFGPVFFLINLPFYILAWMRMGPRFTVKSFIAVAMLSVFSTVLPQHITFETLTPLVGALLAGALAGLGLIALFRHGASLGGIGVLALYLQDKTGFRAGWTQLIFDACLFSLALYLIGGTLIVYSLLGAVITNLIVGVNHRADRYTGR